MQLGVRGKCVRVSDEHLAFGNRVQCIESRAGTVAHRDGERAVDVDHERRPALAERLVEIDDTSPIGRRVAWCDGMAGRDASLEVLARDFQTVAGSGETRERFVDQRRVPLRAILLRQEQQATSFDRFVIEHPSTF